MGEAFATYAGIRMNKIQAFVSHISGESELATLFKERIEADFLGLVDVFVSSDGTGLNPGAEWLAEVTLRLRNADIYMVLCSQQSVDRPWINIELGAALARDKRVVPICHTDLKAGQSVRRPLSDRQAFDASNPEGLKNLYEIFREELACRMPSVDFSAMAREVQAFETKYRSQKNTIDLSGRITPSDTAQKLQRPEVLCLSSEQFRASLREDLALILAAFPEQVHHQALTRSQQVKDLLSHQHFDIVHVASYVCPASGDLVFSDIDPVTRRDLVEQRDKLAAEVFRGLIAEAKVSLVVLAHNETLALVAKLLPVTNVVFALEPVDSKAMIEWIKSFYGWLAEGHTLADACHKAFVQNQIPMKLYPRLPEKESVSIRALA